MVLVDVVVLVIALDLPQLVETVSLAQAVIFVHNPVAWICWVLFHKF